MKAKQIITYHLKGEAYTSERALSPSKESPDERMVESNVVNLYPEFSFQTIEGFGGAMTETSAYLLSRMDEDSQTRALEAYFGADGLHTRFVRVPIDSCDYSLEEYQAVADPLADPEFATFSIDRDRKYVIPMLKKAMELSAQPLSVLMSPWSPPYQWKTAPKITKNDQAVYGAMGMPVPEAKPQRCFGGSLKREHYGDWARYVVTYLQAYLAEGIPVTMLSLQNETVAATTWDSCVWTPEESKIYLKDYLYPEMKKAGLTEKIGIFIWDHNKERMIEHVLEVLDEETLSMVEGIAFHWYSGDHFEAVDLLHQRYPDKTMMLSECCTLHMPGRIGFGGDFGPVSFLTPEYVDYLDAAQYAHDIIGNLNAGMNRWIDWNFLVDEDGGPRHVPMGFTSGLIVSADGSFRKPLMYHYIGHFSRYIASGAKRIGWSKYSDQLDVTAVQNPDGTCTAVLLNRQKEDSGCFLRLHGHIMRIDLPAETISTILIEE